MSFFGKYCLNVFYFVSVWVIAVIYNPTKTSGVAKRQNNIHAEYYWGSNEFRSSKLTCEKHLMQIICFNKCGKNYICENDDCICKNENALKFSTQISDDYYQYYKDNQYMYSKENDIPQALRTAIEEDTESEDTASEDSDDSEDDEDENSDLTTLRHHIAHFCPTLKKARTCIRGCMKLGLPAFCGKDHVCHCGHKYTTHDKIKKISTADVYAQYKDIYTKYFGPKIFDMNQDSDE